jgi:hypothetical protein
MTIEGEVEKVAEEVAVAELPEAEKLLSRFFAVVRKLVDKVDWHTEDEAREAHAAVNAVDPATQNLPVAPEPEPQPAPPVLTPAEQADAALAQEATGGVSLHAASSATVEPSPAEASTVDPTGAAADLASSSPADTSSASGAPDTGAVSSETAGDTMPPEVAAWLKDHGMTVVAPPTV